MDRDDRNFVSVVFFIAVMAVLSAAVAQIRIAGIWETNHNLSTQIDSLSREINGLKASRHP